MKYTHDAWIANLPDNWTLDETEECISFYSPDESRSLHVSDYFKEEGNVTLEDIQELAESNEFKKTNLPFLEGVHQRELNQVDGEDEVVLTWWLYMGNHLLFVEYICLTAMEKSLAQEIEDIVYSIQSIHSV